MYIYTSIWYTILIIRNECKTEIEHYYISILKLLKQRNTLRMQTTYILSTILVVILAVFLYRYCTVGSRSINNVGDGALGSGEMFDSIAAYYDSLNTVMSLNLHMRWKSTLVDILAVSDSDKVLDIATGTGDVAILIAESIRSEGGHMVVHAIDPSKNMLEIAEKKANRRNMKDSVRFRLGDAMNLVDIKDNTYTKVSMSFGVRNVPDRLKALRELYRVMTPTESSVLCVMEFVPPTKGFLAPVAGVFITYVIPLVGSLFAGGHDIEYKHLSDSIMKFPDAEEFAAVIESAGFAKCEIINVFFHVVIIFACPRQY